MKDPIRWGYDFSTWEGRALALVCAASLVLLGVALFLRGLRHARAIKTFGEPGLVQKLGTYDATARRAVKAVLMLVAMAVALVAFARPKFGKGTKLIPATNLDLVIVLDYSKSMYARDITPSRITRAKAEVARLIQDLPGARFGAVAFAGEPMSFPLTSDGAAIAQFFRQLEPNDMPIGGTATARALELAREVFARDPKAKDHKRIVVLVTDGEDLEGDPTEVAKACAQEGTTIDVVQIGGRAPEVIPEVGPDGKVTGLRRDESGKPLTTELSAEGEKQLAEIAQVTGGLIVRAEHGETGIDTVAKDLQKMMKSDLSEKVETVYDEEYAWPLGIAVLLFVIEAAIAEAPKRLRARAQTKDAKKRARPSRGRKERAVRLRSAIALVCGASLVVAACGWNPSKPFERDAPPVKEAIAMLDAGEAGTAATTLEEYLSTGGCAEGQIGTPEILKKRADGTFDLGLALFKIGESFGRRFGEEEADGQKDEAALAQRRAEIDCALRVVRAIAADETQPIELRARAHYLEGNLEFLGAQYEEAVRAYDQALVLAPAEPDAGDPIGRDAAWNRAIALRRIEDKKDAGNDASPDANDQDGSQDASQDAPKDSPDDAPKDAPSESGKDGGGDAGHDGGGGGQDAGQDGGGQDAGQDAESQPPPPRPDQQDAAAPPPRANQDDRILDQLENAPTVQQEQLRRMGPRRRVRGMQDK